jgi:putative heme degradation protein
MGVVYYLLKDETKEYYELGKGYWVQVFSFTHLNSFKIKKYYKKFDKFKEIVHNTFCIEEDEVEYWDEIAEEIYFWCSDDNIRVTSDCVEEDNIKIREYKEAGTRYRD